MEIELATFLGIKNYRIEFFGDILEVCVIFKPR